MRHYRMIVASFAVSAAIVGSGVVAAPAIAAPVPITEEQFNTELDSAAGVLKSQIAGKPVVIHSPADKNNPEQTIYYDPSGAISMTGGGITGSCRPADAAGVVICYGKRPGEKKWTKRITVAAEVPTPSVTIDQLVAGIKKTPLEMDAFTKETVNGGSTLASVWRVTANGETASEVRMHYRFTPESLTVEGETVLLSDPSKNQKRTVLTVNVVDRQTIKYPKKSEIKR